MEKYINLIYSLKTNERKKFFKYILGFYCFENHIKLVPLRKTDLVNETQFYSKILEKTYTFIYKYNDNQTLLYSVKKDKIQIFNSLWEEISFKTIGEFCDNLPSEIIYLFVNVVRNTYDVFYDDFLKNIFRKFTLRNDFDYNFILGSGIGLDYGMPTWSKLQDSFIKSIDTFLIPGSAENIIKNSFNTNYGYFQILKDINKTTYYDLLDRVCSSCKIPNTGDYTILNVIARIVCSEFDAKEKKVSVLTFNYDDLLEKLVVDYTARCNSVFKNSKLLSEYDINIIHSHGFLPRSKSYDKSVYFDSVVLTTSEYIANYKSISSYGYKCLYEFLDKTSIFIGNSITDYEEQKTLTVHFEKNPASFHFSFLSMDGMTIEAVSYKTISLIKMGIIPLWYYSHDEYKEELAKSAKYPPFKDFI